MGLNRYYVVHRLYVVQDMCLYFMLKFLIYWMLAGVIRNQFVPSSKDPSTYRTHNWIMCASTRGIVHSTGTHTSKILMPVENRTAAQR